MSRKHFRSQWKIGDRKNELAAYLNLGTVFKSLREHQKAKEYLDKALLITMEIGDRQGKAAVYGNLGTVFESLGEYQKAKEYFQKALPITVEIGDRQNEATACGNLGSVLTSLGEHQKAKEYLERALLITMEIGDRKGKAAVYGNLGTVSESLGEYQKAKEYLEKALAITMEIGDRQEESVVYINLANVFSSLGEYQKAKEYLEKALPITMEIRDRKRVAEVYVMLGLVIISLGNYRKANGYFEKASKILLEIGFKKGIASSSNGLGHVQASLGDYQKAKNYFEEALAIHMEIGNIKGEEQSYLNLGKVCSSLGEYLVAEEYLNKALLLSSDIGYIMDEFQCLLNFTLLKLRQFENEDAFSYLFQCIEKFEKWRNFLKHNDQFQISFLDEHGTFPYMLLSRMFLKANNHKDALYCEEMRRARALADLMSTQYSVGKDIFADTQPWFGNVNILIKESKCNCLYISYLQRQVIFWVLEISGNTYFREITISEETLRPELVVDLDGLFNKCFLSFGIFPVKNCEDRSLNDDTVSISTQDDSRAPLQGKEIRDTETSLCFLYKTIIAPVADLLTEPEIIIVPDRCLYQVPFAALRDEPGGKYLSETFRFRIVPSLTTLKLIKNSPADYHSQTGALIVGDPEAGKVLYKGKPMDITPLPCARKEAEMVGRLLGVQPLLGVYATKQAVLEAITSVSLIHFAAHGNAERGEIALCPSRTTNNIPKEEDYLLKMSDISQIQLRAKLVVLSCCHTGRGQVRAEGIVGIARAFLGSVARSVLVALWALDDTATEKLMTRFYEHLVRGESASESLHQAMKWMRSNGFTKVSQWAPFVLIGDDVTFDFENKGTFIS